jgi:hypothetical protein
VKCMCSPGSWRQCPKQSWNSGVASTQSLISLCMFTYGPQYDWLPYFVDVALDWAHVVVPTFEIPKSSLVPVELVLFNTTRKLHSGVTRAREVNLGQPIKKKSNIFHK